jgi:hypothetical protein
MSKYSILLKITAVLFGTLPFVVIGLFFIAGGPDPGSDFRNPFRFIGIPLFLAGVFWALPTRILVNVKVGLGNMVLFYLIPGAFITGFFVWLAFSSENSSGFLLPLSGVLILVGIGSAAAYHFKVWKKEDEEFHYIKSY